jgi:hypothetical protein
MTRTAQRAIDQAKDVNGRATADLLTGVSGDRGKLCADVAVRSCEAGKKSRHFASYLKTHSRTGSLPDL